MKKIHLLILLIFCISMSNAQNFSADPEYDFLVTISTDFGEIKLILFEDTPLHRENFLTLVEKKVYNATIFHRVINNFMIQGGDPNTKNEELSDEIKELLKDRIPAEISPNHLHVKGAVAAARQGDQVNPYRMSSPTQFYIVQNNNGTPHLNGAYTVFGQVISGIETVDKIAAQKTGYRNIPVENIKMTISYQKLKKSEITKLYNYSYQ